MPLHNCRIVLVGTHYAGNLGSTARAMRNFGMNDLVLVAPYVSPNDLEARRLATHGLPLLDSARVVADLSEAISDCILVLATSAIKEGVIRHTVAGTPVERFPAFVEAMASGPVALVFGPEPHGLSNAEIMQCHGLIHIPVDPEFSSLNLAQAVAICLYEVRKAFFLAKSGPEPEIISKRDQLANAADLERMFDHLRQGLEGIHYVYGQKGDALMHAMRTLIVRAGPTGRDVRMLHGLARQLLYVAGQEKNLTTDHTDKN
jgi:tRNA/rRNA methyltransferase